jgi:acid stress chaperone HdeB
LTSVKAGPKIGQEGGTMKKVAVTGLALVLFMGAPGAQAQVTLDVAKITCGQFVAYKVTNPKYLAVWLSGYDHGRRGDTVIDTQQLIANVDKLESYCLKNPDELMMKAAETILEPQN